MPALCLGEAIVDLVCEHPVSSLAEADAFSPRFGGATANVAVMAARHGADVALAGGAGADPWGEWLLDRLREEGVATDWFALVPGLATPIAFATIAPDGEPTFLIYGEGIEATIATVGPRLDDALASASGLFFGSNTLVGEVERSLTMAARAGALARGLPVVFDPNLRLPRWRDSSAAVAAALTCVEDALLVKLNRAEAELLTGEPEPARAAEALVGAGARAVVVTLGADGAVMRGAADAEVPGVPARPVSTVGAGDALAGVLLARLSQAEWAPEAAAAALPEAVTVAARVTEQWGAVG
jgi:fructokinase